jgi:hypothetical protein
LCVNFHCLVDAARTRDQPVIVCPRRAPGVGLSLRTDADIA